MHFTYLASIFLAVQLLATTTGLSTEGTVVGITDGDTITVRVEDISVTMRVRLEGIDAPEKKQPYGKAAKKLLSKLCHGKKCVVIGKGKDRYGRTLADILVDGKSVNLQLVEAGLAWHSTKYNQEKRFAQAEIRARKKRLGLWADPNAVPPWEFRSPGRKPEK